MLQSFPHVRKGVETTMPPKRRRKPISELECHRRQVRTSQIKSRSENTRCFKKTTSCVHLAPYKDFVKMYRTVRLQRVATRNVQKISKSFLKSPTHQSMSALRNSRSPRRRRSLVNIEHCGFAFFGYGCKTIVFFLSFL